MKEKLFHWESCKRLKYHPTCKEYMQKPESIQEMEAHKMLKDF